MEPFVDSFMKAIGNPANRKSCDAPSSSVLPSLSWSTGAEAINHNCNALGEFESSRSWRSAGPLLVTESAMHIDEMPVRLWKMPGVPADEGVALCGTFLAPCIDAQSVARLGHNAADLVQHHLRHHCKKGDHNDEHIPASPNDNSPLRHHRNKSSRGGSEGEFDKMIDKIGPDEMVFYQEVDIGSCRKARVVFYSCVRNIGPGKWRMLQWTVDCPKYIPPELKLDKVRAFQVWTAEQEGLDVMVTATSCYIWPDHDPLNKLWMAASLFTPLDLAAEAAWFAKQLGDSVGYLLHPDVQERMIGLGIQPLESPYRAVSYREETPRVRSASIRVRLMARTVDCIDWKPEDQLGGEFLRVDTGLHPNKVQSVKISTELPNLHAPTFANFLFQDAGQELISLGWHVKTVAIIDSNTRIVRRTASKEFIAKAEQMGLLGKNVIKHDLTETFVVCKRNISDGRWVIGKCRAPETSQGPDEVNDRHPNFWEVWIISSKGMSSRIVHGSFARHSKKVDNDLKPKDYKISSPESVLAVEEAVRLKLRVEAAHSDGHPHRVKGLGLPVIGTCMERVMAVQTTMGSREGKAVLKRYSVGIRGFIRHGVGCMVCE